LQTAPTSSSTCQRHLPTAPANGTLSAALGSSTWQQHLLAARANRACQQHIAAAPANSICADTRSEHLSTATASSNKFAPAPG